MGMLLLGLASGFMWLRTLNFVLVQQDLGQVITTLVSVSD